MKIIPNKNPKNAGRKRLPYDRKKYVVHGEVNPDCHRKYQELRGDWTNREILESMIEREYNQTFSSPQTPHAPR